MEAQTKALLFSDKVVLRHWLLNGHDKDIRLASYCLVPEP